MAGKIASLEVVIEELVRRGWCFRKEGEEAVRGLIQGSNFDDMDILGAVELELLNMDLRDIGGKSLPDSSSIKRLSYLQGPKIVQLVSVRDLYQSSIDASFKNSQNGRRLLRFCLTDGHSEIVAIEYAQITSIIEEIIPGVKLRLENKIPIHNGILCLDSRLITLLGGLVQSLYEEWQMSQKYSGFSRSTMRVSQSDEGVGPPPFEKLQTQAHPSQVPRQHSFHSSHSYNTKPTLKGRVLGESSGSSDKQAARNFVPKIADEGQLTSDSNISKKDTNPMSTLLAGRNEDKPSSSESRPKEAIEATPVQNQAAAQKLLQRMSQPAHDDRKSRASKFRGKGKEEEPAVFTLDEWEKRKSNVKPLMRDELHVIDCDEEFARQLQNQLDLEDFPVRMVSDAEAEKICMSMFNFGGAEQRNEGRKEFRGRGRGRGRGKRRFG